MPGVSEQLRPTLLVGIGGTGCEIAVKVYALAEEAGVTGSQRIAILGFDTDVNDIERLRHLSHCQLIRTSTPATVFQLLASSRREQIQDWFVPDEDLTAEIRQMSLMDGAGQIRMLSRLAFQKALEDSRITADIHNVLRALAIHDNRRRFEGQVNVMLAGSLAGGTGSGMFLQTALLLGRQLRELGMAPEVRGLFLLPDIFVNAARLPSDQLAVVKANGYSALQELNAVLLQTAGRSPAPVRFAWLPGLELEPDGLPLKSVALMDYENEVGGNLGRNFEGYKDMAARAAYTLLFTPIGGQHGAVAVNDVRARMGAAASGDMNYYAGIGVGAVVYPQDRIQDYLALRFGLHLLEGDWLKLDQRYREELDSYHRRVNNGETQLKAPVRAESYIRHLDQLARERVLFFRQIYAQVHPETTDAYGDTRVTPQYVTYLEALESRLQQAFWSSSPGLARAARRQDLAGDALTEKAALLNDVRARDQELRQDRQAIEEALEQAPYDLFTSLVLGADELGDKGWQDYHLQPYLLKDNPHLVQVRYFLYQTLAELKRRHAGLDDDRKRQALDALPNKTFDDPDTVEIERALDRASRIAESPLPAWLDRRFNKFTDDYRGYYNHSLRLQRAYGEEALGRRCYDLLEQHIRSLLDLLERFFGELALLRDELRQEANLAEEAHQIGAGIADGNRYVFASRDAKQALWEELQQQLAGASGGVAGNAALTQVLYQRFQEERRQDRWRIAAPFSGSGLFRREIIAGFCRKTLADRYGSVYRLSVVAAMRREADLAGRDWRDLLSAIVDLVGYQSEPYLSFSARDSGQRIMFWAMSPAVRAGIGDEQLFNDLFTRNQGESPLVEEQFPDHTLLCLNTRVNLTLQDLRKLHPGDPARRNVSAPATGAYYQACREMLQRILEDKQARPGKPPRDFTPYLDRRWHMPGVLPEIFPAETEAHQARLMASYVLGIALGLLTHENRYSQPVTVYYDWRRRGAPEGERVVAQGHDDLDLLERMTTAPDMVAAISERARELQEQQTGSDGRRASRPEQTQLYQGLRAPATLARILRLSANRARGGAADAKTSAAAAALWRWFHDCVQAGMPLLAPQEQLALLAKESEQQIREALALLGQGPAPLPEETLRLIDRLAAGTRSRLLEEWGYW